MTAIRKLAADVPHDPPASRIPAVLFRSRAVQRELDRLKVSAAEIVLDCAEGKPAAREALAEIQAKIALATFEIEYSGKAQDLAAQRDKEAVAAWKADIQALSPQDAVAGITRSGCCTRCKGGDCVIISADGIASECAHPVLTRGLFSLRHRANPRIMALYAAACKMVGVVR
jgi:hypothetical protein